MRRFSRRLILAMALCISTSNVYAQSAVPVIEVGPNLAVNTTTSIDMGIQIWNSTQEVRLQTLLEEYGRRNLLPNSGGGGDDIIAFLKRLDEVLGEGNALHYQLADLRERMAVRFPGYVNPGPMPAALEGMTNASLHTFRGTLLTAREQLKLSEQIREEAKIAALGAASRSARGNLAVTQAGNNINVEIIQELRKVRQLLGATMNAENVALSNQVNLHAASERVFADWVTRSAIPVNGYSGVGGFGPDSFSSAGARR